MPNNEMKGYYRIAQEWRPEGLYVQWESETGGENLPYRVTLNDALIGDTYDFLEDYIDSL